MIRVLIHPKVLERVRHYVAIAKNEVSCLGIVEKDGEILRVPEVYLPKQICSPANTELDQQDVARLLIDLEREGKDPQSLRLWLHSHGDMKTFWSDTDDATIEGLCNDGFMVSIVVNKANHILTRVDVFEPFRFTFDKVRTEPLLPTFDLHDECKAEIAEKVTEAQQVITAGGKWQDDLFPDFGESVGNEYLTLEQKLRDGEITLQEYLARLDRMEGFI